MKKLLLITLALYTQLLFCATSEQVEQYLSISQAEEELLSLESQFSAMQNGFSARTDEEDKTYDMQLLSIRFNEYIEKNLSENEMDSILQNYKNVIFLQFISALSDNNYEKNASALYVTTLQDDPEANTRINLVEKISKKINNKEAIIIMFDELIKPLIENSKGGDKLGDTYLKDRKESYLKTMLLAAKNKTFLAAKDFSIEELEVLLEVAQTPAMGYEIKAVSAATAYALRDFFLSMASRYDISKH